MIINKRNFLPLSRLLFFFIFLIATSARGEFHYHHSFFYFTHDNSKESFKYNHLTNIGALGATLGRTDRFFLGQSYVFWNNSHQSSGSTTSQISALELGPRLIYFFDELKTVMISLAYHPYVKGTRTDTVDTQQQDISGSSLLAGLGVQMKVNKHFFLGGAFYYHRLTVTTSTIGTTESKVSQTYTTIFPTIDLSFRFK